MKQLINSLSDAVDALEIALGGSTRDWEARELSQKLTDTQKQLIFELAESDSVYEADFCDNHGLTLKQIGGVKTAITRAVRRVTEIDFPDTEKAVFSHVQDDASRWIIRTANPPVREFFKLIRKISTESDS